MFGFEMAYIPTGAYYIATAQQVIQEERRTGLTEILPRMEISLAHLKMNNSPALSNEVQLPHPIDVFFPFDGDVPLDQDKLEHELKDLSGVSVEVSGFASKEGTSVYNKKLSEKRARNVAKIAKKLGVKVESGRALGESRCNVKSVKNYPKCRKVEIIPTKSKAL